MEIIINTCYGGYSLSHKAVMRYAELKGIKLYPWTDDICRKVYGDMVTLDNPSIIVHYTYVPEEEYNKIAKEEGKKPVGAGRFKKTNALYFSERDVPRTDPLLIQIVKELGKEANGRCADLKIIEIPDDISYEIEEYDGMEWIAEMHRTWRD